MSQIRTAPAPAVIATAFVVLGLVSGAAGEPPRYTIADVGLVTEPLVRVNDHGHVVAEGVGRSYIWRNGVTTLLPNFFHPSDVNNSDQVSGTFTQFGQEVAVWSPAGLSIIGQFDGQRSSGLGINDAGTVIGQNVNNKGFAYSHGAFKALSPEANRSIPQKIADSGEIVGSVRAGETGSQVACVWRDGVAVALGALEERDSIAFGINDNGVIVGASDHRSTPDFWEAVVFEPGGPRGLGTLVPGRDSRAYAINSMGAIVGVAKTDLITERAVVWHDDQIYNLNDLLIDGSDWTLLTAYDINESGQIVGIGRRGGESRAYLLNPVPAPSSLAVVVVGLLAARRKR